MSESEPFDPLLRFAELERLVSKICFASAIFSCPPTGSSLSLRQLSN